MPGEDAQKSKRPPSNAFYQQKLRAWQPILTPRWVILTFLSVGIVFIAIGVPLYLASAGVVEYKVQYAGPKRATCRSPYCTYQKIETNTDPAFSTSVALEIAGGQAMEEMKGPVFVYYELTDFYQNHRRYVKSRSDAQLRGEDVTSASLATCEPLRDIERNGSTYTPNPCGLIANRCANAPAVGSIVRFRGLLDEKLLTPLTSALPYVLPIDSRCASPTHLTSSTHPQHVQRHYLLRDDVEHDDDGRDQHRVALG
mgnify:CR=1 FL=1